jgi:hypothetical protein
MDPIDFVNLGFHGRREREQLRQRLADRDERVEILGADMLPEPRHQLLGRKGVSGRHDLSFLLHAGWTPGARTP